MKLPDEKWQLWRHCPSFPDVHLNKTCIAPRAHFPSSIGTGKHCLLLWHVIKNKSILHHDKRHMPKEERRYLCLHIAFSMVRLPLRKFPQRSVKLTLLTAFTDDFSFFLISRRGCLGIPWLLKRVKVWNKVQNKKQCTWFAMLSFVSPWDI